MTTFDNWKIRCISFKILKRIFSEHFVVWPFVVGGGVVVQTGVVVVVGGVVVQTVVVVVRGGVVQTVVVGFGVV